MPDPILSQLAEIRRASGLDVPSVAQRAGVAPFSIDRWERFNVAPMLVNLRAWAGALGYDIALVKREN